MTKTALVVDDAAVVRQLCAMNLRRMGYTVIEGVNGKDALAKTEGMALDIVITDLNMPEMDGIELVKQLRLRKESKFVPIVVLSTVSQEAKVIEGKAAGASGWLFKPFDATSFRRLLRSSCEHRPANSRCFRSAILPHLRVPLLSKPPSVDDNLDFYCRPMALHDPGRRAPRHPHIAVCPACPVLTLDSSSYSAHLVACAQACAGVGTINRVPFRHSTCCKNGNPFLVPMTAAKRDCITTVITRWISAALADPARFA